MVLQETSIIFSFSHNMNFRSNFFHVDNFYQKLIADLFELSNYGLQMTSFNEFFKKLVLKRTKAESEENKKARIERIASFQINDFSTFRVLDYYEEAKSNYINGCFRSCIICSAIAVDQALKYLLISISDDWEETYWEIETKKIIFAKIIERIQKTKLVSNQVISDTHWLRQVRNEIAAHPMYIGCDFDIKEPNYIVPRTPDIAIWSNKVMLRDFKKLLAFLEPEKRKKFEEEKFSARRNGKILKEISLKDYLKTQDFNSPTFLLWGTVQEAILEELAYDAYVKAVKIINDILSVLENKSNSKL